MTWFQISMLSTQKVFQQKNAFDKDKAFFCFMHLPPLVGKLPAA